MNKKYTIIGLIVMVVAIPVAIVLVGRRADTRNFAKDTTPYNCSAFGESTCKSISGCVWDDAKSICKVENVAGLPRPTPTTSVPYSCSAFGKSTCDSISGCYWDSVKLVCSIDKPLKPTGGPIAKVTKAPNDDPINNRCVNCESYVSGVKDADGSYIYFRNKLSAECMCGKTNWEVVNGKYFCGTMWCSTQ